MGMTRAKALWSRGLGVLLLVPLLFWLGGCWLFNVAPVASFTMSVTVIEVGGTIEFTAIASRDEDGVITSYEWDFGDGTDGSGRSVSHTYDAAGTFTVVLLVTDNDGATGRTQKTIYVEAGEPPGPAAAFTASPASGGSPLTVYFDGSTSSYVDGPGPLVYTWDFGDGSTGYGRTVSHLYVSSSARTYTVTLTVTGADGKTGTATRAISVTGAGGATAPEGSPSARFDIDFPDTNDEVAPVRARFDPDDSEADTGDTLVLFSWSFGDSTSTSSVAPDIQTHTYVTDEASQVFSVTLIVLDDDAADDSITKTVRVENYLPTAGFEIADDLDYQTSTAVVAWWTGDEDADNDDDRVTYRNVAVGDRTVWIRTQEIVDGDWLAMDSADPVPNNENDEPAEFDDDNGPNMCFDPEGQTWDNVNGPDWFPNRAWGIQRLRVEWGDGNTDIVEFDWENDEDTVAEHDYDFQGNVQSWTIRVTAIDFLGGEDSFERMITMNDS